MTDAMVEQDDERVSCTDTRTRAKYLVLVYPGIVLFNPSPPHPHFSPTPVILGTEKKIMGGKASKPVTMANVANLPASAIKAAMTEGSQARYVM